MAQLVWHLDMAAVESIGGARSLRHTHKSQAAASHAAPLVASVGASLLSNVVNANW